MAKSTLKVQGAIQVGSLASAPSNPSQGMIYVDSVNSKVLIYDGSQFNEVTDQALLDAILGVLDATPTNYTQTEATHSGHLQGIDSALGSKADSSVVTEIDGNVDDLISLSGVAENSTNLGTFTGATISDSASIKSALQELETAVESAGATVEFNDDTFRVRDNLDTSKKIAFQASGITTATTRTITMPDSDVNLGDIATNASNISTNSSNISTNSGNISANTADIADLRTTQGTSDGDTNLGTFTGTTISDLNSVKGALQELETAVEAKAESSVVSEIDQNVNDLISLSGVAENSTNLGTFTGSTIADSSTVKAALQSLETEVELKIDATEKGAANGVATLGADSKIPSSQIPAIALTEVSVVADIAARNALTVQEGDVAKVTDASADPAVTSGSASYIYDGAAWIRLNVDDQVLSVNSQTGSVVLDADDIDDSATINKFASAAQLAKVDFISITQAVDLDSVESLANSALQPADNISELTNDSGYITSVSDDTAPSLGGNLTLGANVVIHDADGLKLGSSASDFYEQEYIHSISLLASQTGTAISALSFAHASFDACEIVYKFKDSAGALRQGTLRVVTDGTSAVVNDLGTELGNSAAIEFDAAINGANVEIRYDSGANTATMRCEVKRFKV